MTEGKKSWHMLIALVVGDIDCVLALCRLILLLPGWWPLVWPVSPWYHGAPEQWWHQVMTSSGTDWYLPCQSYVSGSIVLSFRLIDCGHCWHCQPLSELTRLVINGQPEHNISKLQFWRHCACQSACTCRLLCSLSLSKVLALVMKKYATKRLDSVPRETLWLQL